MADMHFKDIVTKRTTPEKVRECKGKEGAKERGGEKKMKVCFTFTAALRAINF